MATTTPLLRDEFVFMDEFGLYRHWHSQSERFAGGDCLATALMNGWTLKVPIINDVYWCMGSRQVNVYHCNLVRGEETMHMPVLGNPYMDRLIHQMELPVIVSEEPKQFLLQAVAPAPVQTENVSVNA